MPKRLNKKLSELGRHLLREWNTAKNGSMIPEMRMAGSKIKVWWKCRKGHEWESRISHRVNGSGCPYCSGRRATTERSLSAVNPHLARQWNKARNNSLTPKDVTPSSHQSVWWKCRKGHEWKAKISNRNSGKGCPYCAGKRATKENALATVCPNLAKEWNVLKNGELTPHDVMFRSTRNVWWKCRKGHEWQEEVRYRVKGRACPVCILKAMQA